MRPRLSVAGVAGGEVVVGFDLAHGEGPREGLLVRGWLALEALEAFESGGVVTLAFAVEAVGQAGGLSAAGGASTARVTALSHVAADADLTADDLAAVTPHQRAAAYGLVTSPRGLLLTELSDLTNAPGRWTLPGGGIDLGESPVEAFTREVWEETGQVVSEVRLLDVVSSHWIGRAPCGRVEDFHAVRIIFAAECPQPSDPVVHDLGGSTSDAAWVAWPDVASVDVVRSFAALVDAEAAQRPQP
ncbi:MAG TPA: NUDIX domain-containing protein [Dermatophilaceae bacterium]|nr:NUDIX domain-containing protein [Dermatophilaceae bacterium]